MIFMKVPKFKLNSSLAGTFVRILLSLTVIVQTSGSFAQSEPPRADQTTDQQQSAASQTAAQRQAVAYHAEGSRDVVDQDGSHEQISSDVTLIQPQDQDDFEFAGAQLAEKFAEADQGNIPTSYAVEEDNGKMVIVSSRNVFLEKLRAAAQATKSGFSTMNQMALADYRAAPRWTLVMIGLRGGANFAGAFMTGLSHSFTTNSDVLGATTSFTQSALLLWYNSPYSKYVAQINEAYPKLLFKGYLVQFIYLSFVKASILAGGSAMDHSMLEFLRTTNAASVASTITQTPISVAVNAVTEEYAAKNPDKATRAIMARNLMSVVNSGFGAYIAYLILTHNPHTTEITWAVTAPFTLFVAYKQNWLGSAKKAYQWTRQNLNPMMRTYSLMAYGRYFDFITKLLGRNSNPAYEAALQETSKLKEQLHGPTCRALGELVDPS